MDVVVTSPMSGAESQHLPYDSIHMNNEAVSSRRNLRYTSPDASSSRSPRRISNTAASHNAIPVLNGDQTYPTADHTSPAISPFLVAHALQEPDPHNTTSHPEINGQNHDRMEMDVDSEDSASENQLPVVVGDNVEASTPTLQQVDGENMDTTPDSPVTLDSQQALHPGRLCFSISRPICWRIWLILYV